MESVQPFYGQFERMFELEKKTRRKKEKAASSVLFEVNANLLKDFCGDLLFYIFIRAHALSKTIVVLFLCSSVRIKPHPKKRVTGS